MSITNEDRYHLQERANEVLGEREGTTVMELLPPVGWTDVTIKSDAEARTTEIRSDIDLQTAVRRAQMSVLRYQIRADFESAFRRFESRMFTLFVIQVGAMCIIIGMLIGVLLRT